MERSSKDILDDLVDTVIDHEGNRDDELSFFEAHGYEPEFWTDADEVEHDRILDSIRASHERLVKLCREAGNNSFF